MLQLVCEIFLAILVVFLVYLAFRKIFAVTCLKEKREDLDKKSDSNGNNRNITKH